jgi:antitoxin ParD1/3/4
MSTMNISLPDALRRFVDEQVASGAYGTSSEYVRELIRRDQDRHRLRDVLLGGGRSPTGKLADADYFQSLRKRVAPSVSGPADGVEAVGAALAQLVGADPVEGAQLLLQYVADVGDRLGRV